MRKPPAGDTLSMPSEPVSRILDGLWMGGFPPIGSPVGEHFDCLVLAAVEYQSFWDYPGIEVEAAALNDDGTPMTKKEMASAVRAAGKVVKWMTEGKSVLVTCRMGKNRSGLIVALVLCFGPSAMTPDEAVILVRSVRGAGALSNREFLKFLRDFYAVKVKKIKRAVNRPVKARSRSQLEG